MTADIWFNGLVGMVILTTHLGIYLLLFIGFLDFLIIRFLNQTIHQNWFEFYGLTLKTVPL